MTRLLPLFCISLLGALAYSSILTPDKPTIAICQHPTCDQLNDINWIYKFSCPSNYHRRSKFREKLPEQILNANRRSILQLSCDPVDREDCYNKAFDFFMKTIRSKQHIILLAGSVSWSSSMLDMLTQWSRFSLYHQYYIVSDDPDALSLFYSSHSLSQVQSVLFFYTTPKVLLPSRRSLNCSTLGVQMWGRYRPTHIPEISKWPNYNQKEMVVTALPSEPFVFILPDKSYDGLDVRIMKTIARTLNFSMRIRPPLYRRWDARLPNGTWIGLVGMVVRGAADIAMSDLLPTEERMSVTDFTIPYISTDFTFISSAPVLLPKWLAIFKPFPELIWFLIFASVILSAVVSYVVAKVSSNLTGNNDLYFLSFSKSFMFSLRNISSESAPVIPEDDSSRVFAVFWMIVSMIFLVVYAGLLNSFLTSPLREKPLLTVSDVINAPGNTWGTRHYGGLKEEFFNVTINQELRKMWAKIKFPKEKRECVESTVAMKYTCFETEIHILQTANKYQVDTSGFIFGKQTIFMYSSSFATKQRSRHQEDLNQVIMRLHENGLIMKWAMELKMKKQVTTRKTETTSTSIVLVLEHLTGAFYLLAMGHGLSIAACLCEIVAKKCRKK